MVMIEDMDAGRPVSAQSPLRAAWKNGDDQYKTSLCALEGLICNYEGEQCIILTRRSQIQQQS